MGICSPFDIVDVAVILRIRILEMLCSGTGDVGELLEAGPTCPSILYLVISNNGPRDGRC